MLSKLKVDVEMGLFPNECFAKFKDTGKREIGVWVRRANVENSEILVKVVSVGAICVLIELPVDTPLGRRFWVYRNQLMVYL